MRLPSPLATATKVRSTGGGLGMYSCSSSSRFSSMRRSWARRASSICPNSCHPSSGALVLSHFSGSALGGTRMGQTM